MEKYAVDLDKVLDELEYNEDRTECVIVGSGKRQINVNTTHAQDASPISHIPSDSGDNFSKWRPKTVPVSQKTSVSGVFSSLNDYINSGCATTSEIISTDDKTSEAGPPAEASENGSISFDEKPDLIDSMVLRPNVSDPIHTVEPSDFEERPPSQGSILPDIATTGASTSTQYEETSTSFDLISHQSNAPDLSNPQVFESEKSHSNSSPISKSKLEFGSFHNLCQDMNYDELSKYLSDLELEEDEVREKDLSSQDGSKRYLSSKSNEEDSTPDKKIKDGVVYEEDNSPLPPIVPLHALLSLSPHDTLKEIKLETSGEVASVPLNHENSIHMECPVELPKNETYMDHGSGLSQETSHGLTEHLREENEYIFQSADETASVLGVTCKEVTVDEPLFTAKSEARSTSPNEDVPDDIKDSRRVVDELKIISLTEDSPVLVCSAEASTSKFDQQIDSFKTNMQSISVPEEQVDWSDDSVVIKTETEGNLEVNEIIIDSQTPANSPLVNRDEQVPLDTDSDSQICKEAQEPHFTTTTIQEFVESIDICQVSPEEKAIKPTSLSISVNSNEDTAHTSLSTPPTAPVSPTLPDSGALEEHPSIASSSSSPFLTPSASFVEASSFIDEQQNNTEHAESFVNQADVIDVTKSGVLESIPKPIRPCSLQIPVATETVSNDSGGSSEDSLPLDSTAVGPPGATPCANRPPLSEMIDGSSISEEASGSVDDEESSASPLSQEQKDLGKLPPFWVPDAYTPSCMQCDLKFTIVKRRHHCRACGKVLCSKCCCEKALLDYMDAEARVCGPCKTVLLQASQESSGSVRDGFQPNPNNPMEYCSTVPPLLQVAGSSQQQRTPSVMVPVGVLKREGVLKRDGSTRPKSEVKQVMFSDGIRPGGDLAELDGSSEPRLPIRRTGRSAKRVGTPPGVPSVSQRTLPPVDGGTMSYIPRSKGLPPVVVKGKDGIQYEEDPDPSQLMAVIRDDSAPPVKFTINRNLYLLVKILNLDCCVNSVCWCFTSDGLSSVGQDEVVIILEVQSDESTVPRDIFIHINTLYLEAAKGNTVTEMGHTLTQGAPFLGSKEHGGFLYVRPTFQCLHRLILPPAPYLVGVLIHKWETPWARVFPIRLMLRLGAEFRYYPCPLVSIRERCAVYGEIGHTIIQVLADFRNMVYTLPTVRGLVIHMEDKQTTILLPRNRYDQVMRALNNSNDHVLSFGANFSQHADSHLVCMQSGADHTYHTQAINIHNKPRKVTGASFVVFNGALKPSCGMAAKSTIVEDGLMVKVTSETMTSIKAALKDMKDLNIACGPINQSTESGGTSVPLNDEVVLIKWTEDDRSFNLGVLSCVDGRALDGVPSIRVHNGTDYHGEYRFMRWTEVFILESQEGSGRTGDPVDISRLSEQLAKATCLALVKLLDLLAAASLTTLAVRATIHPDNVGYSAGSNGEKLPPIYMNSLDNALVPVLHEAALMSGESPSVLELVFRVMESG